MRVLAATPVDLATRMASGDFRADLFYRLSVLCLELPPLRQRREDVPVILSELLRRRGFDTPGSPGNLRELRNVIDRALALSFGARDFESLRLGFEPIAPGQGLSVRVDVPFKEAKDGLIEAFEAKYLTEVHRLHDVNL